MRTRRTKPAPGGAGRAGSPAAARGRQGHELILYRIQYDIQYSTVQYSTVRTVPGPAVTKNIHSVT